jgi:uncharacterized membrane protein
MLYDVLKILHLIGVVVLIGNVTVTSFWKVFADRSGDPRIIAHAQYLVTVTDWFFTLSGIVLVVGGGFGAAYVAGMPWFAAGWLRNSELLFLLSGLIWLAVLVPTQIRQARQTRAFAQGGPIPDAYWRNSRLWLIWGVVATVPLIAALYVMVAKPS